MNDILTEMEEYAKQNKIPIILPPTKKFLEELIKEKKPKKILEVGTAIGYSASVMLLSSNATITCFEASKPNIVLAKQNFEKLNLSDRVTIVEGDCLKTLPNFVGQFDFIFLDGPKGFYPQILKLLLPLLKRDGCFVADNVGFRGMVSKNKEITEKRFQKTVIALNQFLDELKNNSDLDTKIYFEIGDGLAVATWRKKWT